MSGQALQEHTFVRVLYDFQYKTTEGREIAIKKNEKLYLLQKTNADWWQVVRTWEQRSFYVPATYVKEMSRTSRKSSEEDKDTAPEPLDGPKYKNMPKETSSAMKNVRKWLAGAMDSKHESFKTQSSSDESHKHNAMDYAARAELKIGLAAIKTKSLERDRDQINQEENARSQKRSSEIQKKLLPSGMRDQDSSKASKYFSTSPKSFDMHTKMEMSIQDPFRKELENSLDRIRKKSDSINHNNHEREVRKNELFNEQKILTKSSHSDDSHIDSDIDERYLSCVNDKSKKIDKPESKMNLSLHEELSNDSLIMNKSSGRISRSLDNNVKYIGKRTERSLSPKPTYGHQLTIAEGEITDEELDPNTSGDHKILNDKRRTWAVEELMSELTQMCRERVNNKKSDIQLKSTEIKTTFDPLDELTKELHEMNLLRSGDNTPQVEKQPIDIKLTNTFPSNVCKILIKSENKTAELNGVNQPIKKHDESKVISHNSNISGIPDLSDDSVTFCHSKNEKQSAFTFHTSEETLTQTKSLKSPKSPKILDEYNEANILNDCSSEDLLSDAKSLSHDKQSGYHKCITKEICYISPDNDHEAPSYSNIKLHQINKVKMRPKIQTNMENSSGELKLTPSLEKLANEIQFLPANRVSYVSEDKSTILNECISDGDNCNDSGIHDGMHKYNDCWSPRTVPIFIKYAGSFKTKREGRYFHRHDNSDLDDDDDDDYDDGDDDDDDDDDDYVDDNDKKVKNYNKPMTNAKICGLKKSTTLHYITIPDNYRRFRTHNDLASIRSKSFKRQSRSLTDLRCFDEENITESYNVPKPTKTNPVPLPRKKLPTKELSSRHEDKSTSDNMTNDVNQIYIPMPRKINESKIENSRNADVWKKFNKNDKLQVKTISNVEINIESSTAVGFKSLLCTSESGSDNCLQSKDILSHNNECDGDNMTNQVSGKYTSSAAILNQDMTRRKESPTEEQILSSNASSEALQSQSESEVTVAFDASSQPSPVNTQSGNQDGYQCTIQLPPGWSQKYDLQTDQICFVNEHGDRLTMNDKYCLMEEKSLLACAHVAERNYLSGHDGLSNFSKAEIPAYSWLPNELRKKIAQSCKDVRTKQGYPVVDWLKQIRNNCDYCECEITTFNSENCAYLREESNFLKFNNIRDLDFANHCTKTSIIESIKEEINPDKHSTSKQDIKHNFIGSNDILSINNANGDEDIAEKIERSHENDLLLTDIENVDIHDHVLETICENLQNCIEDSHTFSLTDVTIYPRRALCCVNLIQYDFGYSATCYTNTECNILNSILIMNNDDNYTLKICHMFLEELTENSRIRNSNSHVNNLSKNNSIKSSETLENVFRECATKCTHQSFESSNAIINVDKSIIIDCENNLSIAHIKGKFSLTFPDSSMTATHWTETFNNFDAFQENDQVIASNDLLYNSCENFDNNTYIENSYGFKVEDSNYKSMNSENCNMPESLQVNDENTTTFNNYIAPIYENWNARLYSECSSQLFDDPRTPEFYPPCDFTEMKFGDTAVVKIVVNTNDEINEFRKRKGSTASDIIVWKIDLLYEAIDDEEDDVCEWFSSNDDEGKIYFFEENSNESSWVLPTILPDKSEMKTSKQKNNYSEIEDDSSNPTNEFSQPKYTSSSTSITNQSIIDRDVSAKKSGASSSDWPQLSFDGNMRILKEGPISRTKITENGKKLRKNWNTSYAVLTELFLLFFKDSKTFSTMMKSGQSPIAKPDISVDLNGALVEPGETASSRKNVYRISTVLGLQVLIQSDNTSLATEWFHEIHSAIRKLPLSFQFQVKQLAGPPEMKKISSSKLPTETSQPEDYKKISKVTRSRSMKMKRLDDSLEDLSGTVAERQTKIKAKLRRFFLRRPTVESLVKDGIYKDEPAFGSYLKDVCPPDYPRVPLFVKTCIEVLESNEDNMKTDGLYRASGNLSQIQKIRLQIDQYNLKVLSQEEDVHVLTGALKLFFRELKEPLIPSSFFEDALNASMLKKTSTKIQCFREIIKALPPPNHDTLQFLLKHLLKVTSYQEFNRMHIPNLAIVFGPTLMWPAEESANMALDLMQQNLVIECLLSEYNKIFK
ncbi:hypothetical protein PV326_005144 [Microctonus aethiopoides]|nr:hypothetical protein PV326_005144 [Microctonus aethiopoides]